jgi:2-hydroxychromene-2-carboxylate isomerase
MNGVLKKMSKTVDFYFDFGSPAAYLAWTQLPKLCADAAAQIAWRPMLLGGVFQATGNRAPITVPLKGKYLFVDLGRFAKRYGVVLCMNPNFPINTITLMRIAVGLQMRQDSRFEDYCAAMFRAIWVDAQNINDPGVLTAVLAKAGFDAAALLALSSEQDVKDALKAATEAAVQRGVFGAPTFFVADQMFWGQDRLDFVREALVH